MTKKELLSEINLALENNACLMLRAGDYFNDYAKIILPHTMKNFLDEINYFGANSPDECVAIHSVDLIHGGAEERNEYYIYNAKAVVVDELEAFLGLVGFTI